jgi:hypothetical protein
MRTVCLQQILASLAFFICMFGKRHEAVGRAATHPWCGGYISIPLPTGLIMMVFILFLTLSVGW